MATQKSTDDERGAFRQAWDRLTAGSIDDPTSEASLRYRNADNSISDTRKTDEELMSPSPTDEDVKAQMDADVPAAEAQADVSVDAIFKQKFADAPEPMPAPVSKPAARAPSKPAVKAAPKPVAVAPSAESQVPAPMADKMIKKPLRYEPMAERGKDFSYAGEQAKYDAANPDEVDEVEALDQPNAFGAKFSMPKSLAEQIRMIWQGKDYKPSASVKVKARPVAASQVDKIPR